MSCKELKLIEEKIEFPNFKNRASKNGKKCFRRSKIRKM